MAKAAPAKPKKPAATPIRAAPGTATPAKATEPASNKNWRVVASTPEEVAAVIAAGLQTKLDNVAGAKAKKAAAINKDAEKATGKTAKGTPKRGAETPIVKSKAKTGAKSPDETTVIAPAREGRPYIAIDEPMIVRILAEVSDGKSLYKVCRGDDMPNRVAVLAKFNSDKDLRGRWVAAMEARADKYAEETIDIADDGSNDTYVDSEGMVKTDYDVIARSKLRIDARKWYAAKLAPKYSEKVDLNHGIQPDNPLAALLGQLAGKNFKPVE